MAEKTYAQLSLQTTVEDSDLLASWRVGESGPLKRLQSSVFKAYVTDDLGTASTYDIGTSGGTVPLLNAANTWSAAQGFPTGSTGATQSQGDNSTKLATTAYVDAAIDSVPVTPAPGNIWGLTLSAAGSTATFGIALGTATDSTNAAAMALASAYTKTTSAWAVGTGNGALDTGAIANNTWYHVYLISRPDTGVVDVIFSVNGPSLGPTMPTNYTLKRRIGSMKTNGSAQWIKFTQNGDTFLWDTGAGDVATSSLGTTATLYTLTVPPAVQVTALMNAGLSGSGALYVLVNSPDQAVAVAGAAANMSFNSLGQSSANGQLAIRTNTSQQIRAVSSAGSTGLNISTQGWIDTRGRDA